MTDSTAPGIEPTGLIIHAPTAGALRRARRNWRNFQAQDPRTPVYIVANAAAVAEAIAVTDPVTDGSLLLCRNSLDAQQLTAPQTIRTVASAIIYIHRQQRAGWTYARA